MSMSFPPRRPRLSSPDVYLMYEHINTHRFGRSSSPGSDSEEDDEDYDSFNESDSGDNEPAAVMGEMDIDTPTDAENNTTTIQTKEYVSSEKTDGDAEDEDEESKEELLRKRVEKRKGKQPEQTEAQKAEARARRRARRMLEEEEAYNNVYRPILTIKSSQGFVWNQDLFVPAWQKDRYLCSTSPSSNFSHPTPAPLSSGMDFEVECVEIRVRESELNELIPR
ncbi:uncharacterized protein EI90DRAFT_3151240 [Cantharellus anzutake]|uniref:uncharacterized protein n=1 Tax=Cantharellus anzutake TaxID=1750568 RepID=UPI0019088868|nr:uncharacterized protein EI90DRAFT_3151240 [Cantharellus anzutake]KAF8339787.1 hypothetical protein EI90DRAFT_3151240 [Cantharellus anzutake]